MKVTEQTLILEEPYIKYCNSILHLLYTIGKVSKSRKNLQKTPGVSAYATVVSAEMRSNRVIELKIWVLQVRCFFSDFHEVSSWKCRHATKSWESGHRKRCAILSYNTKDQTRILEKKKQVSIS